jgi:hypothetical protein
VTALERDLHGKPMPRVTIDGGDVVLILPYDPAQVDEDANCVHVSGSPSAAEELAHALLLCAKAARGRGVTEQDKAIVERMVLR